MAGGLPAEMMRLSEAAEIAYERLYSRFGEMSVDMREAIAFSLCARLDVFGFRDAAVGFVKVTRTDLQCGSTQRLAVRRADVARLVDWLITLSLFRTPLAL